LDFSLIQEETYWKDETGLQFVFKDEAILK